MSASVARTLALLRRALPPVFAVMAPRGRRRRLYPPGRGGVGASQPSGRSILPEALAGAARRVPGRVDRRQRELEAAVPEVLDVLRATIAAGVSPRRALQAAAEAAPISLAAPLTMAVRSAELGSGAGRALADAGQQCQLTELVLAGEALDLAEATGAPAGRVLAGVTAAAADRVRGRQARLAATAEARLSARVVAGMAPGFLVVLAFAAPADTAFLVRSPAGWATLAAATFFEVVGAWWASRIVAGTSASAPRSWRPGRARRARPRSLRSRRTVPAGGAVLVGGAVLAFVAGPSLAFAASLAAGGVLLAVRVARRRGAGRGRAELADAAPAVIDLLGACLLAGLNPYLALQRVAERSPEALRAELTVVTVDLELGRTPGAALRAAADRTGLDELRAAASVLGAAERWGTPPAEALAARAEALRTRARLHAEAEAGRAAVRLAFPLVFCFLPAFVLLVVLPILAGALHTLAP